MERERKNTHDVTTPSTPTNTPKKGWRFATESTWTLWHTGVSRQGHPRYTGAQTGKVVGGPTQPPRRRPTTNEKRPQDTDKRQDKRAFSHECRHALGNTHKSVFFDVSEMLFALTKTVMEKNPLLGNLCASKDVTFRFCAQYNSQRIDANTDATNNTTTTTTTHYIKYQHAQIHTVQTHHTSFEYLSISSAITEPLHTKWHEACTGILEHLFLHDANMFTRQGMGQGTFENQRVGQGPRTLALRACQSCV